MRDTLRPIEQDEPVRDLLTPDNISTETLQPESQNSIETRKQLERAVIIPIADKPVFPLIPGRTLPSVIPTGVDSGTGQESTSAVSAAATVGNIIPPPAVPSHSGAGQITGHFLSSSVIPNVQQVAAVTGAQGTIVQESRSDRTPFQVD